MKITMISCSEKGYDLMKMTASALEEAMPSVSVEPFVRCGGLPDISFPGSLRDVVGRAFAPPGGEGGSDALVFFAAAGIAVRVISPFVSDKFRDPAVIVVDEAGRYCISLLGGHAGGANRLAGTIAGLIGAEPVITTATDREGLFSVDGWAAEKGLAVTDREKAKGVSVKLLAGEEIAAFVDPECPLAETYARELLTMRGVSLTAKRREADVVVSARADRGPGTGALLLTPRDVVIGVGMKRGLPEESVRDAVFTVLADLGLTEYSVSAVASIDLKRGEPGLTGFAERLGVPLVTFSADELMKVPGDFARSGFVERVTGADNVCERSACLAAGPGAELIMRKSALKGVTVAAARKRTETRVLEGG